MKLWVLGRDDTASSDRRSKSVGCATVWLFSCQRPGPTPPDSAATSTITRCSTAGVPHHLGFRTSAALPSDDTDWSDQGPAERSTAGLKWSNPWFHPTRRAMWAGTMSCEHAPASR